MSTAEGLQRCRTAFDMATLCTTTPATQVTGSDTLVDPTCAQADDGKVPDSSVLQWPQVSRAVTSSSPLHAAPSPIGRSSIKAGAFDRSVEHPRQQYFQQGRPCQQEYSDKRKHACCNADIQHHPSCFFHQGNCRAMTTLCTTLQVDAKGVMCCST